MNDGNSATFTPTDDPENEGDAIENGESATSNAHTKREPTKPMEDWEYYF